MAGPSSQNGRSTTRQASTATGPDEALLQLWRIRGVSAPLRARGSRNLPENCATGSPACLALRRAPRGNVQCCERSRGPHDPRERSRYDHEEVKMWNSVRICLCLMCLAVTLPTAEATPTGQSRESVVSSNIVTVAHKCPQGQRWVPAGYAKHGKYRVGHCSPR